MIANNLTLIIQDEAGEVAVIERPVFTDGDIYDRRDRLDEIVDALNSDAWVRIGGTIVRSRDVRLVDFN